MNIESEINRIHSSAKKFSQRPVWTYGGVNNDKWLLRTPLAIDYVTVEGLYLDGWCFVKDVERCVTFNLLFFPPSGLSGPIARIDWLPTHNHKNYGRINGEWKWKEMVRLTHAHSFDLNKKYGWGGMVDKNLPIALPVQEDLNDFRALLGYIGGIWNINETQSIPVPEWSGELDLR